MENILSQQEMVQSLIKLDRTRTWLRGTRIYNYEKVDWIPLNPLDTTQRKLGHLNHVWGRIEEWIEKVREWKLSLEWLLTLLK